VPVFCSARLDPLRKAAEALSLLGLRPDSRRESHSLLGKPRSKSS